MHGSEFPSVWLTFFCQTMHIQKSLTTRRQERLRILRTQLTSNSTVVVVAVVILTRDVLRQIFANDTFTSPIQTLSFLVECASSPK